ncbi:MAG: amidase family protein [Rhodobacteraceae bacterium]|nr:amidase family protein [Paracoccaceae bacterium]
MGEKMELWQLSAADIVAGTSNGDLTALEVTEAALARIDAVNPHLNAVVDTCADTARAEAEALDASDAPKGPLHGVPVTIKINVDQKGHGTSNGVPAFKDIIAPDDAPVVQNLRDAGAIIIGRTNTPEFSFRADTDNPRFGRTYNPWGSHISPGGSSGGAGSAVMAGIGALAHGNDIGGSLRFPASANGAVTVKPGLGRVPAYNPSQTKERGFLAQCMSVQGLIARSASDLHVSMPSVIAPDPRDPFHVPLPWRGVPLEGPIKVAVTFDDFGFGIHPEVKTAIDKAASALSDAGYAVEEVEPPFAKETGEVGYRTLLSEVRALMGPDIAEHGSPLIKDMFDEYFRQFPNYEGAELLTQLGQRTFYARKWSVFMEDYPLVLTPFLLQPFFKPGRDAEGAEGVRDVLGCSHWSFVMSYTGLPAGSLPTHIADLPDGPQPMGVQIAGRRWREDLIVDAMEAIEARTPSVTQALWRRMDGM